jgi:hypothetical protein
MEYKFDGTTGERKNLDGIRVGDYLLEEYFGISIKTGTPFPDEPRIESHSTSIGPYGASLILYDKTEQIHIENKPRLAVRSRVIDNIRDLSLHVDQVIPREHLLERNRERIITRCKEACEDMGLIFLNWFYSGYDRDSATKAIAESLHQAAMESCSGRKQEIDKYRLDEEIMQIGFLEIHDFDEFKKCVLGLMNRVGFQASPPEKLRFLKLWVGRLKQAGIISYS